MYSESLTDRLHRPLRDLRISVTDRCNLRCQYCMPEGEGIPPYPTVPRDEILSFEEITRVARAAVSLGVRKLRITGGEPLLRKDLARLVDMLSAMDGIEDLALTTNGLLLPKLAASLKQAGLQRATISLDTMDDEVFRRLTKRPNRVQEVLDGIDAALDAGLAPIKVNAVVMRGLNDDAILPLIERFRHTGVAMRFIEYMDVGNVNNWRREDVVTASEMRGKIEERYPLEPIAASVQGEVATRFRFKDGGGEVGFISSISRPFCGDCNRLRLSPSGELFTCLFATKGFGLRAMLRAGASDEEVRNAIAGLWRQRQDRYSEERFSPHALDRLPKVEMHHIGG